MALFGLFLVFGVVVRCSTARGSLGPLSLDSAGASSSKWRCDGKVNVLLGVQSHHKGWNIDNLLSYTDVALLDKHACVVDRLGKPQLEHLGLQSSLQKVFVLEAKDVVQLVLRLVEHSNADEPSNQCITLKESSGVLLLEGQQLSGSLADLAQGKAHSPQFVLVFQPVHTNQLQFVVEASLVVGTSRNIVQLGVYGLVERSRHKQARSITRIAESKGSTLTIGNRHILQGSSAK
jgi:hypothetical protein